MGDQELVDFGIWRRLDDDVTDAESKRQALEASQEAIAELEDEGVDVEWVRTDVLDAPDDEGSCAYCHYRAPSEDVIEEHSERADLPATEITRLDDQLDRADLE